MTFAALRTVAAGLKGVGAKAIGGRLAAGLKQGAEAGKLGQRIPVMADLAESSGPVQLSLFPATAPTAGDVGQNLAARFGNALTTPPAQSNIMGTAIGIGLGQNPLAALGSNVAGNYAGRAAGNYARQMLGPNSLVATAAEGLVNFGVSYKGGEFLSGLVAGQEPVSSATEQEAQMRQAQAQVLSQRQMPSNGGMRQMADLQGAAGAYQQPLPPEGRSLQMADRPSMVMADIPPLDAATADKLRKRAIENAQGNIFSATQLGSYMEGM
jgi:hypothetical protein